MDTGNIGCLLSAVWYSGRFDTSERDAFIELPCSELCGYYRLLQLIFKPVTVLLEDQRSAASCERNTEATLLLIELVFYAFYNPGQKSFGQYSNIHIFLSFLGSLSKTVHHFRNVFAVLPPPTLYKVETRKKFWIHASNIVCGVRAGVVDLYELKNALKTQKCPKTFVHDCSC